nr:MAG TPA: hypothetical protein [Caudoviricetes sp.]
MNTALKALRITKTVLTTIKQTTITTANITKKD